MTDRVIEVATIDFKDEDDQKEQLIVMSFMHLLPEAQRGKLRLCKFSYNEKKGSYELNQVAPSCDFPHLVNCMCTNFRDKNELVLGSG